MTVLSAPRAKALVMAAGDRGYRRGGRGLRPRLPPESLGHLPAELGAPALRILAAADLLWWLWRLLPAAAVLPALRLLRAAPVLLSLAPGDSNGMTGVPPTGGAPVARCGRLSGACMRTKNDHLETLPVS